MNSASISSEQLVFLPGNPQISVVLRRSRRSKRLSLRISRIKGLVTLSLPISCPLTQAKSFLIEKEPWIRKNLIALPTNIQVCVGTQLLYQGNKFTIRMGQGKKVIAEVSKLIVPGPQSMISSRTKVFLKLQARQALRASTDFYAEALGRPYGKLTLRDTISRWGSCSSAGNINYSWRLIMAPSDVLNYVCAHEAAHLVEMNHSPKFWSVVEQLFPNYDQQRNWLKVNGENLHSYKF